MHDQQLYPPWGTVTPAFWASPSQDQQPADAETHVPVHVQDRLSRVVATAQAGQVEDATSLAHQLEAEITTEYGETHLHTVHIREVLAHLAHLTGDQHTALHQYLSAARLRTTVQGPHHDDIADATHRAYGLWQTLPAPQALRLGGDLLIALTELHGTQHPLTQSARDALAHLSE